MTRLAMVGDAGRFVDIAIEGPSFGYNQILRVMGLVSEIAVLERPDDLIEKCFDTAISKTVLQMPSQGLILRDQVFKESQIYL